VAANLLPGLHRVFYVPLSTGNVMDRYTSIAWGLGSPTERNRTTALRVIRTEITRLTLEAEQRPILIVDEAHHLRNEVLEDLRLLTNYRMDAENRLCLLLVGLTELRRRLAMALHESLARRIVVRYQLAGLEGEKLPDYLTHRWRLAGCELPLLEPPAIDKAKTVIGKHVQSAREEIAP
jgi:type II secretory pathway predicted ATPase ExeA